MFYEEKVIDGILCHRSTPDGEWIQFTLKSLTTAFIAMKSLADDRQKTVDKFGGKLAQITAAVNM